MEEYIGKNQFKKVLHSLFKYESFPIADIEELIDCLPVMPKHGYWKDVEFTLFKTRFATCSECGVRQLIDKDNFCPNCGAKMGRMME